MQQNTVIMASPNDHESAETCTICLEEIQNTQRKSFFPCFHAFHQECMDEYLISKIHGKKDISCPLCREVHFKYGDINYMYVMQELKVSSGNQNNMINVYNNTTYDLQSVQQSPRNASGNSINNVIFESSNGDNSVPIRIDNSHVAIHVQNDCPRIMSSRSHDVINLKFNLYVLWDTYKYQMITAMVIVTVVILTLANVDI